MAAKHTAEACLLRVLPRDGTKVEWKRKTCVGGQLGTAVSKRHGVLMGDIFE